MPDSAEGEAVETPTPESTEPAAAATVEATAVVEEAAPETAETKPAEEVKPEEQDELLATEFKGNKNNRIPYNRVRSIVDNALKKAEEAHSKALAEHTARIQEFESGSSTWQKAQAEFTELVQGGPERLLPMLAHYYPQQYGDLMKRISGASAQPETPAVNLRPDVRLEDGSYGYSEAQIQQVLDARTAALEKSIEERLTQRFAPIEQQFTAQRTYAQAAAKVEQQLAAASKLPKFEDNKQAIAEALMKDETLTLEGAYLQIVLPQLQPDRDKMRQEILAELNAKPRAASAPVRTPAPAGASDGSRSVEDIVRESAAKLRASASV
jgi:hypothetical protein